LLDLALRSAKLTEAPRTDGDPRIIVAASRLAGWMLNNDRIPGCVAMLLWVGQ
jgi:hypothetical protein